MKGVKLQRAFAGLVCLVMAACGDSVTPTIPQDSPTKAGAASGTEFQVPQSRWAAMSDAALAAEIARAQGRVFIGFKEPTADHGVDNLGRIIVSPSTIAAAKRFTLDRGAVLSREFKYVPAVAATISDSIISVLRASPVIDYVEPIFPGKYIGILEGTAPPLPAPQGQTTPWNIIRVQAPSAWPKSTGSGVKLMIIDSGVLSHRDLNLAVIAACDGSNGADIRNHGTHVAGIAAALNNSVDVVGVAHGVELWSVKVGTTVPDPEFVACAIEMARDSGVFAINMSIDIEETSTVTSLLNSFVGLDGGFAAAAAGNTNGGPVSYPASHSMVAGVTATDQNDQRAPFAPIGWGISLSAPGVDILSTCTNGSTCTQSGTSMASPHVAAAAAILKARVPSKTGTQIREILENYALNIDPPQQYGFGLLRVKTALDAISLSVEMSGPGGGAPGEWVTVTATVSNHLDPVTYQWTVNGSPACGNQNRCSEHLGGEGTQTDFAVTVTDAKPETAFGSYTVHVFCVSPGCVERPQRTR